ncbi:Uncharacterized protein Fot_56054 [Forsythia ovata]|uniref:Uncharacterized protein n=1 Tax=Forsythia ovata TaxID=205694 RepID=A0ABD1P514_9LAMI
MEIKSGTWIVEARLSLQYEFEPLRKYFTVLKFFVRVERVSFECRPTGRTLGGHPIDRSIWCGWSPPLGYVYRAPFSTEQLPGSDPREIVVYKDIMDGGLLKRKIEDVEKVLAVYNRKVLTLQDSLVKAYKRMITGLKVIEDEKSKEIHHLKKKNSSLRKSCEASKARVKEREDEIDNR